MIGQQSGKSKMGLPHRDIGKVIESITNLNKVNLVLTALNLEIQQWLFEFEYTKFVIHEVRALEEYIKHQEINLNRGFYSGIQP